MREFILIAALVFGGCSTPAPRSDTDTERAADKREALRLFKVLCDGGTLPPSMPECIEAK